MTTTATPKQVAFLSTLLSERKTDGYTLPTSLDALTSAEASTYISLLLTLPKSKSAPTSGGQSLPLGMYVKNGNIYRVHESRESGRRYAKVLSITGGFDYEQGAISRLTLDDRMSLEQAKAFGMETGLCCVCGAFLTDEKSVAEGIGPVCAKRF